MCGIIGYCGPKPAAPILVEGLRRLEYRGYDSAGICVVEKGQLELHKKKGKLVALSSVLPPNVVGNYGIGHTRWATHGEVTDINAHPHISGGGKIAIAHNGIVENHESLREKLTDDGYVFISETDSEVIVHLLDSLYEGDLEAAVKQAVQLLTGTYGIVAVHVDEPDRVVGARNGSPLVLGIGDDEMFLASDVTAIVAHTKQVVYIEDHEVVTITSHDYRTTDLTDRPIDKKIEFISWELAEIEKDGYTHFMQKEILEQASSIKRAMQGRLNKEYATGHLGGLNLSSKELLEIERVKIIGAGTSFYAAMVAAYLIESIGRIPCTAELASEVRYRNPVVERNTLYFAVSQSGETADTLYAMRELQRKGARVLGICNAVGATIPRESDGGVYIHSGPEIAVASTKAFTSQLTAFYIFTLIMARMRHMSFEEGTNFIRAMEAVPAQIDAILARSDRLAELAAKYAQFTNVLFLGRGLNYPVALEGALKLKEVSYIHAEGYSAAEIKHGPIALINEQTPSVFIVTNDSLREKVISNMKEVKARRGPVIALCVEGDTEVMDIADDHFSVPSAHELMYPYLMMVPLQMFAYHTALVLGRDVDQPRNLAKSVTVE